MHAEKKAIAAIAQAQRLMIFLPKFRVKDGAFPPAPRLFCAFSDIPTRIFSRSFETGLAPYEQAPLAMLEPRVRPKRRRLSSPNRGSRPGIVAIGR